MGAKEKKALKVIVPVFAVATSVVIGGTALFVGSDKGQEVTNSAKSQFQAVTVPEDASHLTAVAEVPVGRQDKNDDENQYVDLLGNPVRPTDRPGDQPTPVRSSDNSRPAGSTDNAPALQPASDQRPSAEDMKQVSNIGERFKIPSMNADFVLGSMEESDKDGIEPTMFDRVFWVKSRGVKYDNASQGSVYLAAHALDQNQEGNGLSGLAPGNLFYDPHTKESRLQPGDIIEVGGVKFKYEKSKRAGKGLISRDEEIWDESIPNRLIFLTCLSSTNDNFISYFVKA